MSSEIRYVYFATSLPVSTTSTFLGILPTVALPVPTGFAISASRPNLLMSPAKKRNPKRKKIKKKLCPKK